MANRYIVCALGRPPVDFDIADDSPAEGAQITYFTRGFRILEKLSVFDGYTVCFAWGSNIKLPVLGDRVVAVIYGDEHCRVPSYVNEVAAVIKCHGFVPNFVPHIRSPRLLQIEVAEVLRNLALWIPNGWRYLLSPSLRARCHLVPLGYGKPVDAEIVPIDDRPILLSFLGSVASGTKVGLRSIVGTPKSHCRRAMLRALRKLQASLPDGRVRIGVTSGFQESLAETGGTYAGTMAATKICIAPRGTAHETLRVYEALKLGCVVISDRLPPHPFYVGAPIIQISDWRHLPSIVDELCRDPARLTALQRQSLDFWRSTLSEAALAGYCARALDLRPRRIEVEHPASEAHARGDAIASGCA